jgi:hypothetical protein
LARAKQTNRAEARRRYRQAVTQVDPAAEATDDAEPAPAASGAGGTRPAAPKGQATRPSLGSSFRQAYHQPHYREDLRALPGLITLTQPARIPFTRTVIGVPWFLVSAFLVILGFAAFLTSSASAGSSLTGALPSASVSASAAAGATSAASLGPTVAPTSAPTAAPGASASAGPAASAAPASTSPAAPQATLGFLLWQVLSLPPGGPTLPVLLIGFMATRASYLQGLLIGLLDLALVGVYIVLLPGATGVSPGGLLGVLIQSAVTGLPTSVLFAGAAAWYRRFLTLSSPRRAQPAKAGGRSQRTGGRPANRR